MEINNCDTIAHLYDIYLPAAHDIDFFVWEFFTAHPKA